MHSSKKQIVTLRDIGQEMGVSHVAVSLALRNHKSISECRRRLIQAKAVEMGYTPNAAATALAHFRASTRERPVNSTIAWLNFWDDPEQLRSYKEFNAYWVGACQAAEKIGYKLEEFLCSRDRLAKEEVANILLKRGIEGILLPPQQNFPRIDDFPWEKFCALRFGRSITKLKLHVVTADQVTDAMLAFQKIKALGYRRIGFVSGGSYEWGSRFQGGYAAAQKILGDEASLPILDIFLDREQCQKALENWIKQFQPDAIISDSPEIPEMLGKAGYKIPDDIAFAALSHLDGKSDSGINQNSLEIGRVAVLSLASLLHNGERGIPQVTRETLVSGEWVQGSMVPDRSGNMAPREIEVVGI
jgi:LacI family transcriptional regulator